MIAPFPDLCLLVLFPLILAIHFPWGINGNLQTYPRTYRSLSVYENELYTNNVRLIRNYDMKFIHVLFSIS